MPEPLISSRYPLASICQLWIRLVQKAQEHKWDQFGRTAWECNQFFNGAYDFMWRQSGESGGLYTDTGDHVTHSFKVTVNKTAELVQLFGPAMYFRNPYRQVNPTTPDIPDLLLAGLDQQQQQAFAMQQQQQDLAQEARAQLLQWYLNYTPNELNLKGHSRRAIVEALIKGRGIAWTELYTPPESSTVMPRTVFDTVDNLLVDPDADTLEDAGYVIRRRTEPYWLVERKYGLEPGSLKRVSKNESYGQQAVVDTKDHGPYYRKQGATSDIVTYWEIYSKSGFGHRMDPAGEQDDLLASQNEKLSDVLEEFGDYIYLAVVDGIDYPLNLPPHILELDLDENRELIEQRVRWPIPFWKDNEWPCTELDFHPVPENQWPQAHMKPALGELKLINWIISFLAGRVKWTSRLLIAYAEHLGEEIKSEIESGKDLAMVPIKQQINKKVSDVIQFVEFPPVQQDIWDILMALMELFDKRTGLTELAYGLSGTQHRSATESQIKEQNLSVRPDDMAEMTETWASRLARKEAQCARWFVGPESVAPVFGEPYGPMQVGPRTRLWQQLVYVPLDYNDENTLERVVREFDYRVEAGSIRKPNKERDQSNMDMAMQSMFQPLMQVYMQTGDPTQLNALFSDWAKAYDIDPERYMFPPMNFQPPPEEEAESESPTIPMGA